MSIKATAWAMSVKTDTPSDKLILLFLADLAMDDGLCWPYIKTIAQSTGLSELTVKRRIKWMNGQYLYKIRRTRSNGGTTSSLYLLELGRPLEEVADLLDEYAGGIHADPVAAIKEMRGDSIRVLRGGYHGDTPSRNRKKKEGDKSPSPRARNVIWDALSDVTEIEPKSPGETSRFGKSVRELKELGATPDEIRRRAREYRRKYQGAALTDRALVNRWGELAGPPKKQHAVPPCPDCGIGGGQHLADCPSAGLDRADQPC